MLVEKPESLSIFVRVVKQAVTRALAQLVHITKETCDIDNLLGSYLYHSSGAFLLTFIVVGLLT